MYYTYIYGNVSVVKQWASNSVDGWTFLKTFSLSLCQKAVLIILMKTSIVKFYCLCFHFHDEMFDRTKASRPQNNDINWRSSWTIVNASFGGKNKHLATKESDITSLTDQSKVTTQTLPDHSLSHIRMETCELCRHVGQSCQTVCVEIFVLEKVNTASI